MNELTIVIDSWGHKELKEYVMSLKGILEVIVKNEEQLEIYLKYDSNITTPQIIRSEIYLFLKILKMPTLLAFDKHSKKKTSEYIINCNNLCCEWCLKGAIEDLFDIDGIEKVDSNFGEESLSKKNNDNIKINIKYNSDFLSENELKEIELGLNL